MSLTPQSIPALYGGVSQQAAVSRSPSQCEAAENVDFSIVAGASKRPPLEIINQLSATDMTNTFVAWTRTSFGRWFVIVVPGDGTYEVFDALTGNSITVTNNSAQAYLTTAGVASEDFFAVSLDDKVYIVNRTIATTMAAGLTAGAVAGNAQTLQDTALDAAAEGSIWEILGDTNNPTDTYYVKKVNGKFYEWVIPGIQDTIVAANMPHAFTIVESASPFGADGDFAVETWDTRKVGDAETNKAPSFLGFPIDALFFKSDRLGIISRQNFSCSRVGEYNDFWRSTVTDVLDDDRIDQKVNSFEVSKLRFAETISKSLIMFADERQFSVDGDPVFSPNTVSVNPITSFPSSQYARPVSVGPNVYFISDAGEYSHLRELFVQEDTITMDAANVTAHVPNYIPKDVRIMESNHQEDHVFVVSKQEPSSIYSYQFYWKGNEKSMSAWNKWTIAGGVNIVSLRSIGSSLYVVYSYGTNTYLGRINLKKGDVHAGFTHKVHLDQLQKVVAVYNGGENRTYFTSVFPLMEQLNSANKFSPYLVRGLGWANVASYEKPDETWPFFYNNDNEFYLNGDWTGAGTEEWWIGLGYDFSLQLSEQFFVEDGRPQLHKRVQLRTMSFHFEDTGYFRVDVKVRGHDIVQSEVVPGLTTDYTARTVGDEYFQLNAPQFATGTFTAPILSRATDAIITLVNDSPLPCSFQAAEWKALISRRTR